MKVLRFLLTLPARLWATVLFLLHGLAWVLKPVLGNVAWIPPAWPARAGRNTVAWARRDPKRAAVRAISVLALVSGAYAAFYWYQHRPRPVEPARLTFTVKAPGVTEYVDKEGTPNVTVHPLEVDFSGSAAPIEKTGKPVAAGVTLSPSVHGVWQWSNDRTLIFTPTADWPVGAHYSVRFDPPQVFASHVLVAADAFEFDLPAFNVTLGSAEFYQDPQNADTKQAVFQVSFNYPVDASQFEKRIQLGFLGPDKKKTPTPLHYTVKYDAARLNAWVRSDALAVPRDTSEVDFVLDKGVRSALGGDAATKPLQNSVSVPGRYSLAINNFESTLVDNDKFEPEQVMLANLSSPVHGPELAALTHAWVLPKRNPRFPQADDEPPYAWQPQEVSESVLQQAQVLKLDLVPTADEYAPLQSFKYQARPGQQIYIRSTAGLKAFGGYEMREPRQQVVAVPDYPKLLRFMASGSLLSLSGDKRISVVSRGVPGMQLEIGRVMPDQLQHLVSFNQGNYANPQLSYHFNADHIVERFEQKRSFDASSSSAHYEGIDLGQYLKGGKRGVFLLRLSSYAPVSDKPSAAQNDPNAETPTDTSDQVSDEESGANETDNGAPVPEDTRMVVVTDLGLLVKRALDGSQDVFVQSIHTGQPVAGAQVSVRAVNGQALYTQITGADGVVHFPSFKGLEREKKAELYIVQKGEDLSFLPVAAGDRKLDFSRFDVSGEENSVNPGKLSAYIFSDRGIYRPGDALHLGMIVRAASWARSPAGVSLQAQLVDPRGQVAATLPVKLDNSGFAEMNYTTAETAATGQWTASVYLTRNGFSAGDPIGSGLVEVKEFMPDRMKVAARLSQQTTVGWVKPDQLKGLVDAQNLFGTPAANRRVEATLTLRPAALAFNGWRDYHFFDPKRAAEGYTNPLQDGKTDEKGHAEFDLGLSKYADASYQLYFQAKVYEAEGGRNVAAAAQTLVSSNDSLVGYYSADDLSYITRGTPRSVKLVAINPQAQAMALPGLSAQWVEQRYVSVLTRQDSGGYKYESHLKEIPLEEKPLALPAGGLNYALPTARPGRFVLVIRNAAKVELNRVEYSVAGEANVTRSLDRNAELQINLDKADYKPGESIQIAIRAPYAGNGLITIERDKVYAHAWFHATTTSSIQHITVPAGFEGNGYINVQYVRDPGSDEVFMSPLSYGVVPFSVNVDARRNKISVDAPALVKPGQTVTFKLHSRQPAKAVVFAVDEGILQVARYKLDDPLKFFFRKRMLDVSTSQILDLILPDFKKLMAMSAPGGDGDDDIGHQLNPFKRKRDKPVVFWSGIVDVKGDKSFSYTVPDYFNGKLRVMAVAVSADRVGIDESATTVRGDFVLSPNVPTTLAPGDEADVTVGIANNLADGATQAQPIAVTLKPGPQFQVSGAATQTVSLLPLHEGVASFHIRATDQPGAGVLEFSAHLGNRAAQQRVGVSVRPAAPFRTQVDVALLKPGAQADLPVLRRMFEAYSLREASIATTPVVLTTGLATYLKNFPYICTEQALSASVPDLVAAHWPQVPALARATQAQNPGQKTPDANTLGTLIGLLQQRQNSAGGLGLWSATPDAEPFVSAYAAHVLLDARERGLAVPDSLISALNTYLGQIAQDERGDSLADLRQRAYAVYVLTRQGNVTTNALAAVQKRLQEAYPANWKNDLAAAWLAASYQLLKQDKAASQLIAGPQHLLERTSAPTAYAYADYMDDLTRDASVLYLLARHFPQRAHDLSPHVLENIAAPLERNEFNTLSAAMTLMALDAYASSSASGLDKLAINEVRADGSAHDISTIQGKLLRSGIWSAAAAKLRFVNGSDDAAWRVSTQSGYDRNPPDKAIKNGIEIIREYRDLKGKPVTQVAVGEEIEVHLKIRATGAKGVGNLAIVDLLPGGFDPVLTPAPEVIATDTAADAVGDPAAPAAGEPAASGLGQASSTWHPQASDIREDRVVIYGAATADVREFVYRIKASNAGKFIVPPAYGESMYDRRVQAQSPGGSRLTVTRAP